MVAAEVFFDTNVLLYLVSADSAKADRAEALAANGGVISVQVLNEFASVGLRKLAMPLGEVREVLSTIRALCEVMPIDIETYDLARTSMALHSDTISTRPPIRALPGERGPD